MSNETNITTTVAIVSSLRQLIEKRELLKAAFNQGKDGYSTLLLDIDEARKLLIVDAPRDSAAVQRLLASDKVFFAGSLRGSKLRFVCPRASATRYRNLPALAFPLPAALTLVQNRECFRVKVIGKYCLTPIPGKGVVKAPIIDISIEGLYLQVGGAGDQLVQKQILKACSFDLGGTFGKVVCDLEVRRVKRVVGRGTGLGCRFLNMPARTQALISQFVTQEERKKVAQ